MNTVEQLVAENLSWLRDMALRYCRNGYDAEDLAGETAEKLLRHRGKYDARKSFRAWALTIMRNTFITWFNRRRCVPFTGLNDSIHVASPYAADQQMAISAILFAIRQCARRSVAVECVILYAKGYNYGEISAMLGIPLGTVMSRISNGRKMLRDALGLR